MENIGPHTGDAENEPLRVRCYSGHTYAQRPQSFVWQGREHSIQRIGEEWQEPGKRYFKVVTDDNRLFHLCYNVSLDLWSAIEIMEKRRGV